MMRFRKGTKVEVLSLKEGESGSWYCAEIIDGSSHYYTIRREGDIELLGKSKIEKVYRKLVRPCPPPVDVLEGWVEGDFVEVLHKYFSWKMAIILKVLGCNYFLVRLHGLAIDIKAHINDIRARLCWKDGQWIVTGKDQRFRIPSAVNNTTCPQKTITFVSKLAKKSSIESQMMHVKRNLPNVEPYARPLMKKSRLGNGEMLQNKLNEVHQSQSPEKVENVDRKSIRIHPFEMNMGMENSNSLWLESDDDNASVSSSVASCSVHRNPVHELPQVFAVSQYEDSDAESFCQLGSKEGNFILPSKEGLRDDIHRLELYAYRCTIGALYALGPLSWEQQLLLTDLRDSLHITNDEHLMEIRNLVSSRICINTS